MFRRSLIAATLLSATLTAGATHTDFVIAASGSGPGGNGSVWQTEVTIHNSSSSNADLTFAFHSATGKLASFDLTVPAGATTTVDDIVAARFGYAAATGGISIDVKDDALTQQIAVTSRTFNITPNGDFGQDVPAHPAADALADTYTGVLNGPRDAARVRFNFGLFATEKSDVEWLLVRKDGTIAKTIARSYEAGTQVQYTRGITTFFGESQADNDVIRVNVLSGSVFLFGSAVDNRTGDPTFVPFARTREPLPLEFLGIDLDENGTVDVAASNGVLSGRIKVQTSLFPNYFRIAIREQVDRPVTFTIIDAPADVRLVDGNGTIMWYPGADKAGQDGELTVRVSDGFRFRDIVIPVSFV